MYKDLRYCYELSSAFRVIFRSKKVHRQMSMNVVQHEDRNPKVIYKGVKKIS